MNAADRGPPSGPPGPNVLRGIAWMLVAAFATALLVASVRHVSATLHPYEVTFFRFAFGFLVLLPLAGRQGLAVFHTGRLRLHLSRGLMSAGSMLLLFHGISLTPVAKVTAIQFSAPLFATLVAIVGLRERGTSVRLGALAAGFAGALVVIRPQGIEADWGSFLVLGSAILWGLVLLSIKVLSRSDSSLTISLYAALIPIPFALLAALPEWRVPTGAEWPWLVAVGGLGSLVQITITQSLKEADLTAVLPLDFTRLPFAAAVGYVAFGEVADAFTWIGGTMIFGAAAAVALTERARSRRGSA